MERLDEPIRGTGTEVAEFKGTVNAQLGIIKWVGVFFAGILVAVVVGAGRVVGDASALTSDVKQLSTRAERVEGRLDTLTSDVKQLSTRAERVEGRLDTLTSRVDTLGARMERVEGQLGTLNSRMDTLSSRVERIDGRLDTWAEKVNKQLEILIQRAHPEVPKRPGQGPSPPTKPE